MRGIKIFFFAAVVIFFILCGSADAYYEVIDLGTLGGNESRAYSINDNGQIVGGAYNSSNYHRACLFDTTGGGANTDLGTLGGDYSDARSINNNGQIVGWAEDSDLHACLFDSTGGGANIDLGALDGDFSSALSINDNGQIVGIVEIFDPFFISYACLFDPTGGGDNTLLGSPFSVDPINSSSYAYSINNSSEIVGQDVFRKSLFGEFVTYNAACRYDLQSEGGLPLDDDTSCALSINNNGQIVGWTSLPTSAYRACLFDPTGGGDNTNLGTIDGYNYSKALSINDNGQIVGEVFTPDFPEPAIHHACLFDPTGQGNNIDLNTLIDPSSGWELTQAYSINNNGWIVGWGINPDGYEHAYLLTPEPATIVLLGLGALFVRRKLNRRWTRDER